MSSTLAMTPAIDSIAEASLRHATLRDFTQLFFQSFGAQITPRQKDSTLWVDLPESLVEHFGKPGLHLVFQNDEVTSQTDLMAFGSRLFDQMMDFLDRRGGVALLQLPKRHQGADQLLRAVQPHNAAVLGLKLEEQQHRLLVFNWHIIYRSDDKREELYTVLLNSDGDRVSLADEDGTELSVQELFSDSEALPTENQETEISSAQRLPPMTHLTRLAESARKYALYHADLRCVAYETEILPRLHKVLSRLTSYYEQQIGEVYDSHDADGEKRRLLEEDLQRKLAEEIENHRLRVQVRLFSYAILYMPVAVANLDIGDGKQNVALQVSRNLYTGVLTRPPCHACGKGITSLVLDRAGHLLCDECLRQCSACLEVLCERCGLHTCPTCDSSLCEACSHYCWSCGQRACSEHSSRCPVCADDVCHSCQEECSLCATRQCRTHLRLDGVSGALICRQCAVRCPGCHQDSGHLAVCTASGQRFCTNCIVACAQCSQLVGPAFATQDPTDGLRYCTGCLVACAGCGHPVSSRSESHCQECDVACCGHCGQRCQVCSGILCAAHTLHCKVCAAPLCPTHAARCEVGQEPLCPTCDTICSSCGYSHCADHIGICSICLQTYCAACVGESGVCEICTEFPIRCRRMVLADEPVAADPRVANLMHRYRWVCHGNEHYTIYLGRNGLGQQVLVVAAGKEVQHVRRGIFFGRLAEDELL